MVAALETPGPKDTVHASESYAAVSDQQLVTVVYPAAAVRGDGDRRIDQKFLFKMLRNQIYLGDRRVRPRPRHRVLALLVQRDHDSLSQYGNQASARLTATAFRLSAGKLGWSWYACGATWTRLLLAMTLAFCTGPAVAEALHEKEVAVRAAFLFRLAFFVNWPDSAFDSASAPLVFCLTNGTTPQLRTLLATQTLQRSVRGRNIEVRQLAAAATTSGCHLVYSDAGDASPLGSQGANTLAVVDSLAGLAKAGAVALVREEHDGNAKLQFYVHRERLRELNVSLNAQLMQLARFYEPAA